MIRSMTGYSRAEKQEADFSLSVSIRTTNHRFLDLQVRLPGGLEPLEPLLRRSVKEHSSATVWSTPLPAVARSPARVAFKSRCTARSG